MCPIAASPSRLERARSYRDHVARPLEQPFAEVLAGRALLAAGHTVLEVAGGGVLAPRLRAIVGDRGAVTAVDDDAERLELAAESGAEVTWTEAAAARLPFDGASFDAALSAHGFARSPDPAGALREMRRVLRIGGRVSLAVWSAIERNPFDAAVAAVIEGQLPADASAELAARRGFSDLGEPERLKERLEAAGFVMVSAEEQRLDLELPALDGFLPGYLHAVGLGEAIGRLGAERRDALLGELREALEERLDGGSTLPFRSVLGFGRAPRPGDA